MSQIRRKGFISAWLGRFIVGSVDESPFSQQKKKEYTNMTDPNSIQHYYSC